MARALTAFLVLLATLAGSAQRASSAGCPGTATAGVAAWPAAGVPGATAAGATAAGATAAVATAPDTPPANPGEPPHPAAPCAGSVALPAPAAAGVDAPATGRQPASRPAILAGTEAPEPLLGPPRQS